MIVPALRARGFTLVRSSDLFIADEGPDPLCSSCPPCMWLLVSSLVSIVGSIVLWSLSCIMLLARCAANQTWANLNAITHAIFMRRSRPKYASRQGWDMAVPIGRVAESPGNPSLSDEPGCKLQYYAGMDAHLPLDTDIESEPSIVELQAMGG